MAIDVTEAPGRSHKTSQEPAIVSEQLFCSLTGRPLSADEIYWAPPLVTARELTTTVITTLLRTPGSLGPILFAEQPNVPYAQDAREQLAARRTTEQLKLLLGLLFAIALIATPIVFMTLG